MWKTEPAPTQQGRQDSNLRPSVLETDALPTELRPWAPRIVSATFGHSRPMTDQQLEHIDRVQEARERAQDDLLEEQKGKGDGEDEGEREESLPDE